MGNCCSHSSSSNGDDHPNAKNHLGRPTRYTNMKSNTTYFGLMVLFVSLIANCKHRCILLYQFFKPTWFS